MTGSEHLERIIAQIESMVGPQPDARTRSGIVLQCTVSAAMNAAANLLDQNRFEEAHDLVLGVRALSLKGLLTLQQDEAVRRAVQQRTSEMFNAADPDAGRVRIVEREPSALSAKELVELGVVASDADVERGPVTDVPPRWVAFVTQVKSCMECGADAVALIVWQDVGSSKVGSSSLCESCINRHVQEYRSDPEYLCVGHVIYLRVPEAAEPADGASTEQGDGVG